MKFPRNARIFRGQLDVAPFAAVFFLLVIFMMVSSLVYTPGVRLELPVADNLPGTDKPTPFRVAIDKNGRLYFENKGIEEAELSEKLRNAASHSAEPLTLLVLADKAVTHEMLVRLGTVAREAGISDVVLATLPRVSAAPASPSAQ